MKDKRIFEWTRNWLHQVELHGCLPHIEETIKSTNALAKELINALPKNSSNIDQLHFNSKGSICLAAEQTEGQGRGDNLWLNSDLMMTWYWQIPSDFNIEDPESLSLMYAQKLLKSLQSVWPQLPARVKEPNDVYLDDKKVAGLLLDIVEQDKKKYFILGLGLNVFSHPENIKATDLQLHTDYKIPEEDWIVFLDEFHSEVTKPLYAN